MTSKNKKQSASKRTKKSRRPLRQLIGRLIVLGLVSAVILAIGHFKYGWMPIGDKAARLDRAKEKAVEFNPGAEVTGKLKSVVDKLKQGAQDMVPFSDPTLEPPTPTPEPTPEPKKDPPKKSDEEKLKDFLEKQME